MKVPFVDLRLQYESIKDEIAVAIQEVLESCAFSGGPFVEKFEKDFATFCQCQHAIGLGSGTEALWLSLLALGIGPGDEVITVPNTFIATAEAISFCGAKPVFVDIDEKTYTMDPQKLQDLLKSRDSQSTIGNPKSEIRNPIRAIIPVHLFGQMADMDPIMEIARRHGLFVIEDACQAHGSEYKGKKAGSIGDAGCFSFYPGKNLGAYGEAGAVVTNSDGLFEKIRILRDHGQHRKYYHDSIGWNGRMDGMQGAILSAKLKHLDIWNESRRRNAHLYDKMLAALDGVTVPEEVTFSRHIYHIYAIRAKNRDALQVDLSEKGISSGIHYPVPIHLQTAYGFLKRAKGNFPVAELCAQEFLSLPMFSELAQTHLEYVVTQIRDFYRRTNVRK